MSVDAWLNVGVLLAGAGLLTYLSILPFMERD